MQRALLITLGIAVALLLAWALWPSDGDPASSVSGAQTENEPEESPTPPPRRIVGGRISGFVVRDGQPVVRARVSLRSNSLMEATSLDDGRFLFDDVPSGQVYLSASTADAASEVLALQLVPRGRLEGLQLTLTPSIQIEGRVIDLLTQKPIPEATVVSPTKASRTDVDGKFTLAGARTKTWLEASAPGYLPRTEWVSLELASSGGRLELVLTPSSRLEGVVLESGSPVGAATVWAEVADGARRGERTLNAFTDKNGRFSLDCAAGTLALAAVTPRGIRIKGPLLLVSVGEKKTDLLLDAGEVMSASGVVFRDQLPVVGSQVLAIDASTEDVSALATTGLDGRFRFDGLSFGKYVLQVRHGALMASAGPFEHRGDGQTWAVTLRAGGALVGRVEPAAPGVAVRWRSGTWSGPPAETVTDATGHFRFDGLPDELVSLEAEGPAGSAAGLGKAGDEVVLLLKRGFVTVHLQDDSGAPVTDGLLLARSLETGGTRRQLVLAPNGVARLDLPPGRWQLLLEVAGRGRSSPVDVTVTANGETVRLSLETSLSVSGRVTDKSSGLPIASARIEASSGELGRGTRVSVITDSRGEFLLPPVPRSARLLVSRQGFEPQGRPAADGSRWEVALQATSAQRAGPGPELNQFEGVGMTLDARSGAILVHLVSEGSPAERAGVQRGDQILAVDGVSVSGMSIDAVVQRIRGPSGSPVTLRFQRGAQMLELTIRRRLLTL